MVFHTYRDATMHMMVTARRRQATCSVLATFRRNIGAAVGLAALSDRAAGSASESWTSAASTAQPAPAASTLLGEAESRRMREPPKAHARKNCHDQGSDLRRDQSLRVSATGSRQNECRSGPEHRWEGVKRLNNEDPGLHWGVLPRMAQDRQ
jgi:hypothetical protein